MALCGLGQDAFKAMPVKTDRSVQGLKMGPATPRTFEGRVRELVEGHPTLTAIAEALLAARLVLHREFQGSNARCARWQGGMIRPSC